MDIALAGRPRLPSNAYSVVRVIAGEADWPRIELRYTLDSAGAASNPVEETVVDTVYLRRLEWQYASLSLPYEKRMLDEWFKARFAEPSRERIMTRAAASVEHQERTRAQTGM